MFGCQSCLLFHHFFFFIVTFLFSFLFYLPIIFNFVFCFSVNKHQHETPIHYIVGFFTLRQGTHQQSLRLARARRIDAFDDKAAGGPIRTNRLYPRPLTSSVCFRSRSSSLNASSLHIKEKAAPQELNTGQASRYCCRVVMSLACLAAQRK